MYLGVSAYLSMFTYDYSMINRNFFFLFFSFCHFKRANVQFNKLLLLWLIYQKYLRLHPKDCFTHPLPLKIERSSSWIWIINQSLVLLMVVSGIQEDSPDSLSTHTYKVPIVGCLKIYGIFYIFLISRATSTCSIHVFYHCKVMSDQYVVMS